MEVVFGQSQLHICSRNMSRFQSDKDPWSTLYIWADRAFMRRTLFSCLLCCLNGFLWLFFVISSV